MRVLITGFSPQTYTSYGIIIRELWTRIAKKAPHIEIAQHAWLHYPGLTGVSWPLFPTKMNAVRPNTLDFDPGDRYGEETFVKVVQDFKPDIVWNLSDVYMSRYMDKYRNKLNFKLVRWTLSEGLPIDPDNISSLISADKVVAITEFAAKSWGRILNRDFDVIHHGIDLTTFNPPTSLEEKYELRKQLTNGSLDKDAFLITFIGVNQARKRPWLPIEILAYLRSGAWGVDSAGNVHLCGWDPVEQKWIKNDAIESYAEAIPAVLWMHSADDGSRWRYRNLQAHWNLPGVVKFTGGLSKTRGLDNNMMAKLYKVSDVIHMISGSEGFGMPIVEATACGVPVIYTDYGAMSEIGGLCGGIPVGYIGAEPAPVTHVNWVYPSVRHAVMEYYNLYKNREEQNSLEKMRERYSMAATHFDLDQCVDKWINILEEVHSTDRVHTFGEEI